MNQQCLLLSDRALLFVIYSPENSDRSPHNAICRRQHCVVCFRRRCAVRLRLALRGRYVENLNYFSKVNHEGTGSARWDIWLEMLVNWRQELKGRRQEAGSWNGQDHPDQLLSVLKNGACTWLDKADRGQKFMFLTDR